MLTLNLLFQIYLKDSRLNRTGVTALEEFNSWAWISHWDPPVHADTIPDSYPTFILFSQLFLKSGNVGPVVDLPRGVGVAGSVPGQHGHGHAPCNNQKKSFR
jgi:hypothetical protein